MGSLGQVAVFAARQIVAYLLEPLGARRLFLFRTLEYQEVGAVAVPGVRPRVRLLVESSSSMRIDRVERLFGYLEKDGWEASSLSDPFWLRVGHLLGGRLPRHKVLLSFLARESRIACTVSIQPPASAQ
jgi:hypothetical protein